MVEELLKLNFNILGVVTPKIDIPKYTDSLERLINYRLQDTKKITLLDINTTDNLSSKDISKLQLAIHINDQVIVLYDFSKGLNFKEIRYYKILFNKITKTYKRKIILVSKDINFLADMCDTYAIYDKKIIYSTKDIFDNNLYNYIDMPHIVKFIKIANAKGANLNKTTDINELIKDIYRRKNADKNNI